MTALDDRTVREALPALRRFARSLAPDAASADDLVQATLERALGHRPPRDAARLQPWLLAILYRRFIDEHRRQARWRRLAAVIGAEPEPAAPSAERVVAARDALAALRSLPAEQRAVLVLVAVEGLAYREAADVLGVPIGTVMSRLSRARGAFARLAGDDPPRAAIRVLR